MDKNKHKELINQFSKKHLKPHTNLDIISPKASKKIIRENKIFESRFEHMDMCWSLFPLEFAPKKELKQLLSNFEYEVCDFTRDLDAIGKKEVFMLSAREMDCGFKKSDRYKWIGCIETFENGILWCWIHPYFRRQNIIFDFLSQWFIHNRGVVGVVPPLTTSMQHVLKKLTKYIYGKKDVFKKIVNLRRIDLIKIGCKEEDVYKLLDDEVMKVLEISNQMTAMETRGIFPKGKVDEFICMTVSNYKELKNMNLDFTDEESNQLKNFNNSIMQETMNFGSHLK